MIIDTHSHIFELDFAADLPEVIARAQEVGVAHVLMPNIDDTTVEAMMGVCGRYPGYCFPMLGFHPTSVDAGAMPKVRRMKDLLVQGHPYVAIGEVGMDLYWDKTFVREQQRVLDEQVQWALEWRLPLVLHCREAFPELFEVLSPYKDTPLSGVFHSFTGVASEAAELLAYERFMIGVNGVVTFKNSTLPDALKEVPLDRLVLETDSPYLAPVPFRGKRNEPAYVKRVSVRLSELYGVEIGEVEQRTTANALKVFNLGVESVKS